MAIESVKMGRIPKKLKEKALQDYHKQREKKFSSQSFDEDLNLEILGNHNENVTEERHNHHVHHFHNKRDSISSISSISSSSSSNINVPPSIPVDLQQEIIVIPQGKSSVYHLTIM